MQKMQCRSRKRERRAQARGDVSRDQYAFDKGNVSGREAARREIRKAIAGPLRILREQHSGGARFGSDCHECTALVAIDKATKATRKPRKP